MQAFVITIDQLGTYLHYIVQLRFEQVVDVRFKRIKRMPRNGSTFFIQTNPVHQRVGGIAEQQEIKRIS
ncbi:hypothetical protein D3C84_917230 [compost metagenome]